MAITTILEGNALETLQEIATGAVQCVITSPPYYGLRDYGVEGQIGLEASPEAYVENLVAVFRETRRVLKDDGTLWLNLGDSYWGGKGKSGYELPEEAEARRARGETIQKAHNVPGHREMRPTDGKHLIIKPKDLIGIPWMVAFALRADGWYLRQDIIWAKPNPTPESVTDRCTRSHEYLFTFSKKPHYYYDFESILEPAISGQRKTAAPQDEKHQIGFWPEDGNPKAEIKAETWSMPGIGPKHGRECKRGEEYKPMRGYRAKQARNQADANYGLFGNGFRGHSGNYDSEGNLLGHDIEGEPARNKRSVWFIEEEEYQQFLAWKEQRAGNRPDVWQVATRPYKEAHFATFPPDLITPCILAGSREGDTVLDPFCGSGTTLEVALKHNRHGIGCELNPEYIHLIRRRLSKVQPYLPQSAP